VTVFKHAGATALMVLDTQTDQPIGIITEADIAHVVGDGKDVNSVRIQDLMTARPTVINTTTSVRDAAEVMMHSRFRHLPVSPTPVWSTWSTSSMCTAR
jgi:CBS domain-containing protein